MSDSPALQPALSRHARELARILRMHGTEPGQQVRSGMLEALWLKYVFKLSLKDLDTGVAELLTAKLLLPGRPDGIVMTEGAAALR